MLTLLLGSVGCNDGNDGAGANYLNLTPVATMPVNAGDALTLPAQRHLVRLSAPGSPPRWLLVIQQQGGDGRGLGFFRSNDEARTWRYLAPIQNDFSERDEADLVPVGMDVALVYSWEGPVLAGSDRHDVFFQWWRYRPASDDWAPSAPVLVFDSTSSATAFYRAELARDSLGRLFVQAWRLNADGSHTAYIAVSSDGGATFAQQPTLAGTSARGGGRLISLGTRMLLIWDQQSGVGTAQFRTRADSDPVAQWSPTQVAFGGGIYHGAALSAVADGNGGLHLASKDKNSQLWYRHFDGTSFGPAQLIEGQGNWELQPATTRVGDDVIIFYNRVITTNTDDEMRVRTLHSGQLGAPQVLDSSVSFKGYPAAAEQLPSTIVQVPCFVSITASASVGGQEDLYLLPHAASSPGDLGTAPPDLTAPPPRDLAIGPVVDMAVPPPASSAVLTHHNDPARTGAQLNETQLAPSTVRVGQFGKLFTRPVDGQIYAQPLYVPGVSVSGVGLRNVVYVVTENNSAYAFDADDAAASQPLWHINVGTAPTANQLSNGNINPTVGITGTPVIDPASSTMYFVAHTTANGSYFHHLHAVDIRSGAERLGGPVLIAGSVAGQGYDNVGGVVTFASYNYKQRPGLLLQNGIVYIAFGSHGDNNPYHGWVFGYDAATLQRIGVYNDTADGSQGGIWMSGQGLAGDGNSLYFASGNGSFSTDGRQLGESIIKLDRNAALVDWFTPFDQAYLNTYDLDLGSSGPLLLPGTNLLVSGGKESILYLLNRSQLGHYRSTDNNQVVQSFLAAGNFIFTSPVFWNGHLYLSAAGQPIFAYAFDGARFNTTAVSRSAVFVPWTGGGLSISANGNTAGSGILWSVSSFSANTFDVPVPGVLRAFDAANLGRELWNSRMVAGDDMGDFTKFGPPTIANGRVYVTTTSGLGGLVAYGLLSAPPPPPPPPPPPTDMGMPADLSAPPAGGVLFSDDFNRQIPPNQGLGPNWSIVSGAWYTDGKADSDFTGPGGNQATAISPACANCTVKADVLGFGVPETGLFVRAPSLTSADRYDVILQGNGNLQIRRVLGGVVTVLGQGPSGLTQLNAAPSTVSLTASGNNPVSLSASVAGVVRVSASDGDPSALSAPGYAGLWTTDAGVWFEHFVLTSP